MKNNIFPGKKKKKIEYLEIFGKLLKLSYQRVELVTDKETVHLKFTHKEVRICKWPFLTVHGDKNSFLSLSFAIPGNPKDQEPGG